MKSSIEKGELILFKMKELQSYLPMIIAVLTTLFGAFVIVKVGIAELKKDNAHLREKLDAEADSNKEVKADVKAIFRTLTKIQIDQAKSQGKHELVAELTEALQKIGTK